jgi:EAL domain-containing protein (putative c-di-GMP-specific phosphodiesterase class I)
MAKGLGVKVCAEGVENWEQFNYLKAADCDHVQGYLFSKPCSLISMIESKKKNSPLPQDNVVKLKLN